MIHIKKKPVLAGNTSIGLRYVTGVLISSTFYIQGTAIFILALS